MWVPPSVLLFCFLIQPLPYFLASCTRCKSIIEFNFIEKEFWELIKSIRHKGLKKFFSSGGSDTRGIISDHEDKLRDQLAALDSATEVSDLEVPGWRLHLLKGRDKGRYSVTVNRNWRLTFEFVNGNAYIVDYEDYH